MSSWLVDAVVDVGSVVVEAVDEDVVDNVDVDIVIVTIVDVGYVI